MGLSIVLGAIGGHRVTPLDILPGSLESCYGAAAAGTITFFPIFEATFSSIPDEISEELWLLVEK